MTKLQKETVFNFSIELMPRMTEQDGLQIAEPAPVFSARVGDWLYQTLKDQGEFFVHQSDNYYFHQQSGRAYLLGNKWDVLNNEFAAFLKGWFLCEIGKVKTRQYIDHLHVLITKEIQPKRVYKFSHYVQEDNVLYVRKNTTQWYYITAQEIQIVANGTNGVIGWGEVEDTTVELADVSENWEYLNTIFYKPWFKREEEHALFKMWVYSLFFPELLSMRPIVVLWGATGSGKTITIRAIAQLIFGSDWQVMTLADEQTFVVNAYHNYLLCYDNVDGTLPAGLADKIAAVTTGAGIETRSLYHNLGDVPHRIKPECFFVITSRTPEFNRDDIVNRSIILELAKKDTDGYSTDAFGEFNRVIFWRHLLPQLQRILINLELNKGKTYSSQYRMAGFVDFVYRGSDESNHAAVTRVLNIIGESQSELVLENKPIVDLVRDMVENFDEPRFFSTTELFEKLGQALGIRSAKSFGWIISNEMTALQNQFYFEKTRTNSARGYTVGKKGTLPTHSDNSELVEDNL